MPVRFRPDAGSDTALNDARYDRKPVDTVAALKALTPVNGEVRQTLGYYAANDGGGGPAWVFALGDTTTAVDGGTVVANDANTGRWKRDLSATGAYVHFFGAKGDNVTDDTAAVQAAIDANVGPVVFGPKTYRLASGISVPDAVKNQFVMRGAGDLRTTINSVGTGTFLTMDPSATPATATRRQFWRIEKFRLVGPGAGVAGSMGLYLNNCIQGAIYDVTVFAFDVNVKFDGHNLANGAACYYNNAFNLNSTSAGTAAIHFAGQANTNQMFGGRAFNSPTGVKIDANTTNVNLHGVDIETNSVYGADIAGYGNSLLGCRHENTSATGEIRFDSSGGGTNGRKNMVMGYFSATDPASRIVWDTNRDNMVLWPGYVHLGNSDQVAATHFLRALRTAAADLEPFFDLEDAFSTSGTPVGVRYRERRYGRPFVAQRSPDGTTYYDVFAMENVAANANPRLLLGRGADATSPNQIQFGNNTPEAAVTGRRGDIFMRTNGGAGTTFYVKETGDDTNTGWVPK